MPDLCQSVNAAREKTLMSVSHAKSISCKYFCKQNADFYLDFKETGVINKLGS